MSLRENPQFKFKPSQCVNCLNSIDAEKCKVFGEKPQKYLVESEKQKCPERKVEGK